MMGIDIHAMASALEPTRKGLEAAGFELALSEAEGRLQVLVIAGKEACEDCLVPKSLFQQMADDEIQQAGLPPIAMDIIYPLDARRMQA